MLFNQNAKKLLILLVFSTFSLFPMDYVARNKGKIAAGVGAAATAGAAYYYGYSQGAANRAGVGQGNKVWLGNDGSIVVRGSNLLVAGGQVITGDPKLWRFESEEERQLNIQNESTINIENQAGFIKVESYEGDTVQIKIQKRAASQEELADVDAEITEFPKELLIKTKYNKQVVQALINYTLKLPRNKIVHLNALNISGAIHVQNLKGNLKTATSSGDTKIENISASAICSTVSGSLTAKEIEGNLKATTSSGDTKIENISGNLICNTVSGNIAAKAIAGICKLRSSSGAITASAIKGEAVADTVSGQINVKDVDKNFAGRSSSGSIVALNIKNIAIVNSNSGNIAVENNGRFEARTSSGSVLLMQKTINSPVLIKTNSGNITLEANAINGHLLARVNSGNIRSQFPINNRIKGKDAQKRVDGQLGDGGSEIELESSSGDVLLLKKGITARL